jgi:hypothetical protein
MGIPQLMKVQIGMPLRDLAEKSYRIFALVPTGFIILPKTISDEYVHARLTQKLDFLKPLPVQN